MDSKKLLVLLVLVIVAFVAIMLVIGLVALVFLGLVSGVTPTSTNSGVSETQSRNYWTATSPLSITGWKYSGTKLYLTMQNMDGQKVTLTDVDIGGEGSIASDVTFSVGETRIILVSMESKCGTAGSKYELSDIEFTYTKSSFAGLIQEGDKPIVGKCS